MKIGFDGEKYLELQTEKILERVKNFENKLYIEIGGKLFDEFHGSRVLPGMAPDIKIRVLKQLKNKLEIIFCVSAIDIEKNKVRGDSGLTYDMEVMRLVDNLRDYGLMVSSIVITLYNGQSSATMFANKLKEKNEKVYLHKFTKGYPTDVKTIVSEEGYGANPFVETSRPLVLVAAPGPSSGKLATCLSQLYHEYKNGVKAGYTKFETFPVWNLPLKHPVNVAYEAATADIKDTNMIDPYHFMAYGELAINYNRDIEVFPVLREILAKITGKQSYYKSPTEMGVNAVGMCITDDDAVCEASKQEIIRRYFRYLVESKKGLISRDVAEKVELLMNELDISISERKVIKEAQNKQELKKVPCFAIELKDGTIITGKTKSYMTAPASAVLNAIKHINKIDDSLNLISPEILTPVLDFKKNILKMNKVVLNLKDVLMVLAISGNNSDVVKHCLETVQELRGCEAHSTCILNQSDENNLRNLGLNTTCEPIYLNNTLLDF